MKKQIIFILSICMFVCILGACGKEEQQDVNLKSNFMFIEELAKEVKSNQKSYSISGKVLNWQENYEFLSIENSLLAVKPDENLYEGYSLFNWYTSEVIAKHISTSGMSANSTLEMKRHVYYSNEHPIAIFAEYDNLLKDQYLNFIDSYGNLVNQVKYDSKADLSLNGVSNINDFTYFYINESHSGNKYYFKYNLDEKTNLTTLQSISEQDYENIVGSRADSKKYIENFDEKGNVISYFVQEGNVYYLYDLNKKYLNNYTLQSFGMDSYSAYIRSYTKLHYFKNVSFTPEDPVEYGSLGYKNWHLTIDLVTGEITFNDNLNVFVHTTGPKQDIYNYKKNYILFYELKETGEKTNILKSTIVKDKIDFLDSIIYDGFNSSVYKIKTDLMLIGYNNPYDYTNYVLSNGKKAEILEGVKSVDFLDDDNMIYIDRDNRYYLTKTMEIIDSVKNKGKGKAYISTNLYNGSRISFDQNSSNKYVVDDYEFIIEESYKQFATVGVFITDDGVYVGDQKVIMNAYSGVYHATFGSMPIVGSKKILNLYVFDNYGVLANIYMVYDCVEINNN